MAQEDLLNRQPFDRIQLDAENNNAVIEVFPLELPGRRLPEGVPTGELSVRLIDRPNETYQLPWSSIAKIELYEQMLIAKAQKLTAAGKFDDAYDYFTRLKDAYPDLPGLDEAIDSYLQQNALAYYRSDEHDRALAVLLSLYERNPQYAGLDRAVETVATKIIAQRLKAQEYAAARGVLDLWLTEFPRIAGTAVRSWQRRFEEAATKHVADAREHLQAKRFAAANTSARRAQTIWPEVEGAAELLAEIGQRHPQVIVGVFEQAPPSPTWEIDSWAAQRIAPLVEETLCVLAGYSTEGGRYRTPLGSLEIDESGRRLSIELNRRVANRADDTAHALARFLLALADPASTFFRSEYAAVCEAVAVSGTSQVHIDFERPHVRPEALLQVTLPGDWGEASRSTAPFDGGRFRIASHEPDTVRLERNAEAPSSGEGLVAIVEQTMPDDRAAITALVRGEIDVLDRVPPWQLERLANNDNIRVESYLLPTVHVLIPNQDNPLMAQREFRRAFCYGINRAELLRTVILGGESRAGFQVLSGPFPVGKSLSDPVRYGYNNQIEPRKYEPQLAATLALVAQDNLAKLKKKRGEDEQPAERTELARPLTLVHPPDALPRLICIEIKGQLDAIGIPTLLEEASVEDMRNGRVSYDLRYAELAVWEPVVDAHRVLGPEGLAGSCSAAMRAALDRLDEASNWNEVTDRLADIHRMAHNDLSVIPLWQTVNYCAYRTRLEGLGNSPLTLYQHIENWRLASQGGRR